MNLDVSNIFINALTSMIVESESERIKLYRELKFFYDNDKYEIENYLKKLLKEKGLYGEKTLNSLIIRHRDNIQKSLKRVTAGIYENRPVREILDNDYDLNAYLDSINYHAKIKECFKKARYFGIAELYATFVNDKIRLEVLVPDRYIVETKENDYLEKEKIYIQKSRETENGYELFYEVWSDNEYSIINSKGELEKRIVNDKEVETQPNVYGKIPVIALRFNETDYYYPEPNWGLFDTQIALDVQRTNNFYTQIFQTFGIYLAINTGLKEGESFSPNKIIKADNVSKDDTTPDIKFISPDINWDALNKNVDFEVLDELRSQGINTNSASIDNKAQSGTAKTIDELELIEEREEVKEQLYRFEIKCLELIRTIHNTESSKKIPDGKFNVIYSEEKAIESVDDKVKRREMEKKYNIKSDIDFIMEDLEISEQEAEEVYNTNKEKNKVVNSNDIQDDNNDNKQTNLNNQNNSDDSEKEID